MRHRRDDHRTGSGDGHEPSQRALQAMAAAALRSQQLRDHPSSPGAFTETEPLRGRTVPLERSRPPIADDTRRATAAAAISQTRHAPPASAGSADRQNRFLVRTVVLTAVVLAGASGALGLSLATRGGDGSTGPSATQSTSSVVTTSSGGHHRNADRPKATTGSTGRPTTPPPAIASSGPGAPVITALSPSSGGAGQTVTLSGSNFLSADGQIQAFFGGQPAPTDCPNQDTCIVTVPAGPPGPTGTATVTVSTASGTSNPQTFTYD